MKTFSILLATALILCCLAISCNKEKEKEEYPNFAAMISAQNVTVTPSVLEAVGGKVPATISIAVPAGFTYPTASVALSTTLVWDNGAIRKSNIGGFQGAELPDMGRHDHLL